MLVSDLLEWDLLIAHVRNGVVSEIRHPIYKNLAIYNYTHRAQHENIWDNVTEQCRGLIVDKNNGYVIARPFRKFFNLNTSCRPETMEENLPCYNPRVLEKLDGSLGIYFWYDDTPMIATRGSFASDQAKWATDWYTKKFLLNEIKGYWPNSYTPLFEIIYKENRIVVNYDFEGLVLLGLVNIETGLELSPEEVGQWADKNGLRTPQMYNGRSITNCQQEKTPNIEGFVLQYYQPQANPLRIKIKTEDYVRLHKIITGLNPKGIWEHLSIGGDPSALWYPAAHNQEFTHWCIGWINTFEEMYKKLETGALHAFAHSLVELRQKMPAPAEPQRKDVALAFQKEDAKFHSVLFCMYDGKSYSKELWKLIKPKIQGKETFIRDADQFNGI